MQSKDVKGGAKALGTTIGTFNKYAKVLEDQVVEGIDQIEFDQREFQTQRSKIGFIFP